MATPPHPVLGTHVLQLEFALGPLIFGLLGQEVDSDVTTGDGAGVGWPLMLTQHVGPRARVEGAAGGLASSLPPLL